MTGKFLRLRCVYIAALMTASISGGASASVLFGDVGQERTSVHKFTKWVDMLERNSRQPVSAQPGGPDASDCNPGSPIGCLKPDWPAMLARARTLDRTSQLAYVNSELNRFRYITDPENWGLPDYWASVRQFLARNGDCEDYAISKYMALKLLGVSPDDMRIAVVQDMNLGVPHAVLVVLHNGRFQVLDNQIATVLPDSAIVHYKPIYSINERHWWLHGPPG